MRDSSSSRSPALGAAALGALVFSVALAVAYARQAGLPVKPVQSSAFPTRGFFPIEHGAGFDFNWAGRTAEISFPGLDRRIPWHWKAVARSSRPPGQVPTVSISVDGDAGSAREIAGDAEPIDVVLPARPGRTGATVTIDTTPAFVPGSGDSRELGIALEAISIAPDGLPLPPWQASAFGAMSVLLLGAALAALDIPWPWTLGAVFGVSVGQIWLMLRGAAVHGRYPLEIAVIAGGIALGSWLAIRGVEKVRGRLLSPSARAAAGISTLGCYLKLLVLLHPTALTGDGVFHAHRFEWVLSGHVFFTSIAPGDYAFPYPVLLYLVAAPFSWLTHNTLERVTLLRILVTGADAVAATLLYWMIDRTTSNRPAGVLAVAWYHVIPMTAWIMSWGNLTNAFGQTLFVASLAAVAALPVDRSPRSIVTLAALAACAMLSHPSTCAILAIVLAVTAALYWWSGGPTLRGGAAGVGSAAMAAGTLAFVVYYAWFPRLYVHELSRVWSESGAHLAAATPASPIGTRLASTPALALSYLGWPALAAAAVGAWQMTVSGYDRRLLLLLAGWTGACGLFLLIGVLTPVQMRTYFALFPALAVTAAFGCLWAWTGPRLVRIGVVLVCAEAVWIGVRQWVGIFG